MASNLLTIYDLLAALDMSFVDAGSQAVTVGVIKPQTMSQNLTGVTLPTRVLWLIRPGSEGGVSPVVLRGAGTDIEWEIDDTLYFARGGQGYTLAGVTHDLILYMNAYTGVMAAGRYLSKNPAVTVSGWKYEPGIFSWDGVDYLGVNVALKVRELV